MAASMTTNFSIHVPTTARVQTNRPRHITSQAGHALEILGHAIEYLTDEFVHQGSGIPGHNGQIDAVQLLMAVNRQVYFDCPEIPTLGQRIRAALHLRAA